MLTVYSTRRSVIAPPGTHVVVAAAPPGSTYEEIPLEPGRVFALRGLANDLRLVGAGTVRLFLDAPLKCKACKSEWATAADLKRHELRTHKGGK